jgi:N-acetylglucosaminyldiphosphoundecaprenol N-acetyl-beta-D-mannosaminyltransferase
MSAVNYKLGIRRTVVAGCPVDHLSFEMAVTELHERIRERIHTLVMFVNVFKVAEYHSNLSLRASMEKAEMLLADGAPIVWASHVLGNGLPGRVTGVDLMGAVLSICADHGYRVFLLGAREEVLISAVEVLTSRYPALQIAGYRNGYFTAAEEDAVTEQINNSGAHVLFLGMSSPRKELWADRNFARLTVPICQCVGGTFDIIAGVTQRAPRWMQVCGFEWFYRILQEPRRLWRRYLLSGLTFGRLLSTELFQAWKQSLNRS